MYPCLTPVQPFAATEQVRQPWAMLVFANKIKTVAFCHDFLRRQGVVAEMLHGNLPQRDRETVLANFKAGKIHTLISTDVAARGIHIKRLKYVRAHTKKKEERAPFCVHVRSPPFFAFGRWSTTISPRTSSSTAIA